MPVLSAERDFTFEFSCKEKKSTLRVPIAIPPSQSAADLTGRLVNQHNLPCYVENDLQKALEEFFLKETNKLDDENADEVINKVKTGEVDLDNLVSAWEKAFTEEVKDYAPPEETSKEQIFSEVYHSLIHSPALETLLNLEHTYALTVDDLIQQRDKDLSHLDERQQEEMQNAVRNLGTTYTDDQINQLAQLHFENSQMIEGKWQSELKNQQEVQKKEYRDWVMKVHEDTQTSATPKYMQKVRAMTSTLPDAEEEERTAQIRMEESFTIHLGAQMKTTHNLRVLSASVLDLCRHKPHTIGGLMVAQPQRLQTAMSLYSNNLCALIMLVDNRLNSYSGIKKEFAKVCERSTDFHFPNLEQQFLVIEQQVNKASEVRAAKKLAEEGDRISLKSTSSSSSDTQIQDKTTKLYTGDFYITRHSNLSEVHAVFHLVSDDSIRGDISSRHPVILSLRNIIKLCFRYDIMTLTIPLLLSHHMTEEMTIPWCMKRAELVFKCVKGFIMEMATYGRQESRNIQFLVPLGISDEMFANICNMLPTIFRLSNPVVMVKSPSKSVSS